MMAQRLAAVKGEPFFSVDKSAHGDY